MRKTFTKRITALLLSVLLCIGMLFPMLGTASAADDASSISVQIMLPADWASKSAAVRICITDGDGVGFSSVQAKINQDGSWKDITNELERRDSRCYGVVSISDNCTVFVRVTGHDGQIYENSRYIECFDHTPPTLRGSVSGDTLRVECSDDLSGVTEIFVNGKSYANPANGTLNVPLKDVSNSAQISIQATDRAGNTSQTVQVKNTAYQASASTSAQKPVTSTKPATEVKTATTSKPTAATTTVSADQSQNKGTTLTPDGQATVVDNVTDKDSKEFFTIATQDENTFYLIIDKERDSENVYFLDTVKESDLLSMAEKDKDTEQPSQSAIPDPKPVCVCKDKCAPGEVNADCPVCVLSLKDCTGTAPVPVDGGESKPKKSDNNNIGTLILVALAALAVGAVGFYFKIYKPKKDLDNAEDFDDLIDTDEETVNEDDEPAPKYDPYEEPDEPEYPGDYGYGEPEDEP